MTILQQNSEKDITLIEYKFKKISFIKGVRKRSKMFLFALFMGLLFAIVSTGSIKIPVLFLGIVGILVVITIGQWNIYFIQEIRIDSNGVYLVVFKFDKLLLQRQFKFDEVIFDLQIASASIRGTTYKLVINVNGKVISQYPVNGWEEEDFRKVLSCEFLKKVSKAK